jgi:hypothetical protein
VSEDEVRLQYAHCQSEVLPGPGKILRWSVPDGRRGPDGQLIHDDLIMADALIAKLDSLSWSRRFEPFMIPGRDPLEELSRTRAPHRELPDSEFGHWKED